MVLGLGITPMASGRDVTASMTLRSQESSSSPISISQLFLFNYESMALPCSYSEATLSTI
jgi:hypothetical protein